MTTKPVYILGSHVPLFIPFRDFFPDAHAPDWTDFTSCTWIVIEFRKGADATPTTVPATAKSYVLDGVTTYGLEVSANNVKATLTSASKLWIATAAADLHGGGSGAPCYSDPVHFEVKSRSA